MANVPSDIRCPELRGVFGDFYSDLDDNARRLVRQDVREIAAEELDADDPTNVVDYAQNYRDAAILLRGRIGGASALPSYAACLVAGDARRNASAEGR